MTKITTKQIYIIFILASFSPAIRLSSAMCAKLGGHTGWLSVILSCLIYYGLTLLFHFYFKNHNENADLYTLYESSFGKIGAKITALIYAVWVFILLGFYLRIFGERFATSIMPGSPVTFFIITLSAIAFIVLSGTVKSFACFCDLSIYFILLVLLILFGFQFPKINIENFLPVTTIDTGRVTGGMLPLLEIFGYVTFAMFLSGETRDKQNIKKYGLISACVLLSVNLIIFFMTTGIFGSDLTKKMEQPFLMSVKTVTILDSLERLESVFLLLWVITDLAIIVMLMYVLKKLITGITGVKDTGVLRGPLLCGLYILSVFFANNINELDLVSEKIGTPVNLTLCFGIPALAFCIYKIKTAFRAMIPKRAAKPAVNQD